MQMTRQVRFLVLVALVVLIGACRSKPAEPELSPIERAQPTARDKEKMFARLNAPQAKLPAKYDDRALPDLEKNESVAIYLDGAPLGTLTRADLACAAPVHFMKRGQFHKACDLLALVGEVAGDSYAWFELAGAGGEHRKWNAADKRAAFDVLLVRTNREGEAVVEERPREQFLSEADLSRDAKSLWAERRAEKSRPSEGGYKTRRLLWIDLHTTSE